jgi:hypothetical protein
MGQVLFKGEIIKICKIEVRLFKKSSSQEPLDLKSTVT